MRERNKNPDHGATEDEEFDDFIERGGVHWCKS